MQNTITVIFTKKPWNLISWLIRYAVPRSRFALARSSHCIVTFGDYAYEADMHQGVTRKVKHESLHGSIIVETLNYTVPNAVDGLQFIENQVGKKYDLKGAFGLGISPYRNWAEDDAWFCFELAAATIKASGLDIFENVSHVNESMLMSLKTK